VNFGHRALFSALITYISTQAHGWAGGYATKPAVTLAVWIAVTFISLRTRNRHSLLALAIVTQLGIHFGTLGSHAHHHMQLTVAQMAYAHIAAGFAAWVLLVFSERAYELGSQALRFAIARFKFLANIISIDFPLIRSEWFAIKRLCSTNLQHILIRRGPPVFSSN
jgi:hypothetical protein